MKHITSMSRRMFRRAGPWVRPPGVRIALAVLLVIAAGVLAVPFLVPAGGLRPVVALFIERAIGHDVRIDGLRLHLLPRPHLEALDVHVRNPAGFPPGDAIFVKSIEVGTRLRALLARRIDVTYIRATGVRVNLVRTANGGTNLDIPARRGQGPPNSSPAGLSRIGEMSVDNVDLSIASSRAGVSGAPLVSVRGLSAAVRPIDLTRSDWPKALMMSIGLKGAVVVTPLFAAPVRFLSGAIVIDGSAGHAAFAAAVDTMRMSATAVIDHLNPLSLTFSATIPEVDANRLGRLTRSWSGSAVAAILGGSRSLAQGTIAVRRLDFAPLAASGLTGRLKISTDSLRLTSYAMSMYGGTVRGSGMLRISAAAPPGWVTAQGRGVDMGRLVLALSGRKWITGSLNADLNLSTTLGRDPEAALTGSGTFTIHNGSLSELHPGPTEEEPSRPLGFHMPAGPIQFRNLGGDVRVERRRVYSRALRLTANTFTAAGHGSFGFDETIMYDGVLTPVPAAIPALTRILSPLMSLLNPSGTSKSLAGTVFSIRGTFGSPRVSWAGTPQAAPGPADQPQVVPPPSPKIPPKQGH
jgi:uncharacterized protein involved in outer membrane biogenesis